MRNVAWAVLVLVCGATGWVRPAQAQQAGEAAHGILPENLDTSVKPGDDFFRYSNGGWLKRTEIPADRASISVFQTLVDKSNQRVRGLIEEAVKANPARGTNQRKIADLYTSYMDEAGIEARGLAPLKTHLDAIAAIKDKKELAFALGKTLRADVDVLNNTNFHTENLFGLWVAQDLSDPTRYSPFLLQGGLGMPDRDFYLNPSQKMADIRSHYQAHITAMLRLAHISAGKERAARIFELERRIAEAHTSRAESQEVLKGNNHWSAAEFPQRAPGMDWPAFFGAAGLGSSASSSSGNPARSTESPHSPPAYRWRPGRITCASISSRARVAICRKPSSPSTSPSTNRYSPVPHNSSRAGSARSRKPTPRSARRSANCMSPATSHRRRKRAPKRWCATWWRPSLCASTGSNGRNWKAV